MSALVAASAAVLIAGSSASVPLASAGTTGSADPSALAVGSEVASLRTADSQTFVGAHGTLVAHAYPEPVNYRDSSGVWQPIDDTLVSSLDDGFAGLTNSADAFTVALPRQLGSAPVQISNGTDWVSFSLDGGAGFGSAAGPTEAFSDALPGVDVRYTVTNTALNEDLVLANPSSQQSFSYSVATSAGLTASAALDGSIQFVDASGRPRLWFMPPTMTDAAGASAPASFGLSSTADGYRVTLTPDASWLSSPDRAWPVTIDPSASGDFWSTPSQNPTTDGYIDNGGAPGNYFTLTSDSVGWRSTQPRTDHALFQFNTESAIGSGTQVLNAELNLYLATDNNVTGSALGVYSATRSWDSDATWSTYDGTDSWTNLGGDLTSEPATGAAWATATMPASSLPFTGRYETWNITQLVAGWNDGTVPDHGLLLKQIDETTHPGLYGFNSSRATSNLPYLAIKYYNRTGANGAETFRDFPLDGSTDARVNVGNGNLVLCQTDLSLPGINGHDLTLKRCLNGMRAIDYYAPFDSHWIMTPGQQTFLEGVGTTGELIYHGDSGDLETFTPNGSTNYVSQTGFNATLTASTGTLSACSNHSYAYLLTFHADGSKRYFNSSGWLVADADTNGNAICFNYNGAGLLSSIVDTQGRTINFTYNASNQISQFTAPATNCPSGTCTYSYGYTNGNLTSFTDPTGAQTTYSYDSATGVLTSITDPNGHATSFTYQSTSNGYRVASITDAANQSTGKATTFSYSTPHDSFCATAYTKVTSPDPTAPDGGTSSYCFDSGLRVNKIKAPDGTTSSVDYADTVHGGSGCIDAYGDSLDGQPCSSTDANSQTTTYTYSSTYPEDMTSETAPSGATTNFTYGDSNHPYFQTQVRDPATTNGSYGITTYTYDTAGNTTDSTLKSYDVNNNLLTTVDQGQDTYTGTCGQAAGQPCLASDADGNWTAYTYDASHNLASRTQGLNSAGTCVSGNTCPKTTFTYDTAGRVVTEVAPLGNVAGNNPSDYTTAYTYDKGGRTLTVTDPLGHVTTYTYDAAGNRTAATDPDGKQTASTYDADNRVTVTQGGLEYNGSSWTCPANSTCPTVQYGYDANGNQTSKTDPDSNTTTAVYYTTGRLKSSTAPDPDGGGPLTPPVTSYQYDANGNLTSSVDPRGNVAGGNPADYTATNTYTVDGQLKTTTDPLGNQTAYAYDLAGNQVTATDPDGHQTVSTYDVQGRVMAVETGLTYDAGTQTYDCATGNTCPTTTYTYDGDGNVLTKVAPLGNVSGGTPAAFTTTDTYTNNEQLKTVTGPDPDGSGPLAAPVTSYVYDANGNLTQETEPNNKTITYTYYRDNRLHTITYSDSTPSVTYTYDAAGNRISMVDGGGTVSYGYDNNNRLTTVTRGSDTFTYSYDAAGNVTSRTYPGGTSATYVFNADEWLSSVTSSGNTTSYSYDEAGNAVGTSLPNGYIENRSYDHADRLTDVIELYNNTDIELQYTLDPAGNPTKVVHYDDSGITLSTTTYGYDNNSRVNDACYQTTCNESQGSSDPYIHYTYDADGNRLTQQTASGTTSYSYNNADELTSAGSTSYGYDANGNQTSAGLVAYTYNAANQLASTTDRFGTTTNYTYDGDGNRRSATTGSTTTNYLWDTSSALPQLAVERDGNNNVLRSYLYGVRRISMTTGGSPYYYLYDALGSVVNLTSSTGVTEWSYTYDPFGASRGTTQNVYNAPANQMQFTGAYLDQAGLYDLNLREADPTTGRFLQQDPAAAEQIGPLGSSYLYVGDRPTLFTDPSGACAQPASLASGEFSCGDVKIYGTLKWKGDRKVEVESEQEAKGTSVATYFFEIWAASTRGKSVHKIFKGEVWTHGIIPWGPGAKVSFEFTAGRRPVSVDASVMAAVYLTNGRVCQTPYPYSFTPLVVP